MNEATFKAQLELDQGPTNLEKLMATKSGLVLLVVDFFDIFVAFHGSATAAFLVYVTSKKAVGVDFATGLTYGRNRGIRSPAEKYPLP